VNKDYHHLGSHARYMQKGITPASADQEVISMCSKQKTRLHIGLYCNNLKWYTVYIILSRIGYGSVSGNCGCRLYNSYRVYSFI